MSPRISRLRLSYEIGTSGNRPNLGRVGKWSALATLGSPPYSSPPLADPLRDARVRAARAARPSPITVPLSGRPANVEQTGHVDTLDVWRREIEDSAAISSAPLPRPTAATLIPGTPSRSRIRRREAAPAHAAYRAPPDACVTLSRVPQTARCCSVSAARVRCNGKLRTSAQKPAMPAKARWPPIKATTSSTTAMPNAKATVARAHGTRLTRASGVELMLHMVSRPAADRHTRPDVDDRHKRKAQVPPE